MTFRIIHFAIPAALLLLVNCSVAFALQTGSSSGFPAPSIEANDSDRFLWNDSASDNNETEDERRAFSGVVNEDEATDSGDTATAEPAETTPSDAEKPKPPVAAAKKPNWPNPFTVATEPGRPSIPFPVFSYDRTKTMLSEQVGFMGRNPVFDQPEEGVLVGVIVGSKDKYISNLQAIYQNGDQYFKGELLGKEGGLKKMLMAPPGFAVGGMEIQSSTTLQSLRLGYHRLGSTGKLKTKEFEASDRVGEGTGSSETLDSGGQPIVCLSAQSGSWGIQSVGLVAVKRLKIKEPPPSGGVRLWKSASGKFTIEAQYIEQSNGSVALKKTDGKTLKVKIDQLSADGSGVVEEP